MESDNYNEFAASQHRFWLQILGAHSRFILSAAPPSQPEIANEANYFKEIFDTLLDRSWKNLSDEDLKDLNTQSLDAVCKLRVFKLNILSSQLTEKIKFNLSPTFLNHMVNELEEYMLILSFLIKNKKYVQHPIHYHLLWLSDAYAHASILNSTLDMTERKSINTVREFEQEFNTLYIKAVELMGYMRTGFLKFPAFNKFNHDIAMKMTLFQKFLKELRELKLSKEILGTLTPIIPDHMIRETCYYLSMLSMVSSLAAPDCNFKEPRIE